MSVKYLDYYPTIHNLSIIFTQVKSRADSKRVCKIRLKRSARRNSSNIIQLEQKFLNNKL